jgi:hypothetical protein
MQPEEQKKKEEQDVPAHGCVGFESLDARPPKTDDEKQQHQDPESDSECHDDLLLC